MKKTIIAVMLGLTMAGVTGCGLFGGGSDEDFPPPDYSNISVMVREGAQLKPIVAAAAARRGWSVQDTGENTLRLTISQRKNLVEVDVAVIDETHYSLYQVSSNIPTRKYVQWINNLISTVTNLAL